MEVEDRPCGGGEHARVTQRRDGPARIERGIRHLGQTPGSSAPVDRPGRRIRRSRSRPESPRWFVLVLAEESEEEVLM
jgi:hypothetical protein